MRIVVKVVIEMTDSQVDDLACEYGLGDGTKVTAAEVRGFVKSYIREHAQGATAADYWTATVT